MLTPVKGLDAFIRWTMSPTLCSIPVIFRKYHDIWKVITKLHHITKKEQMVDTFYFLTKAHFPTFNLIVSCISTCLFTIVDPFISLFQMGRKHHLNNSHQRIWLRIQWSGHLTMSSESTTTHEKGLANSSPCLLKTWWRSKWSAPHFFIAQWYISKILDA